MRTVESLKLKNKRLASIPLSLGVYKNAQSRLPQLENHYYDFSRYEEWQMNHGVHRQRTKTSVIHHGSKSRVRPPLYLRRLTFAKLGA